MELVEEVGIMSQLNWKKNTPTKYHIRKSESILPNNTNKVQKVFGLNHIKLSDWFSDSLPLRASLGTASRALSGICTRLPTFHLPCEKRLGGRSVSSAGRRRRRRRRRPSAGGWISSLRFPAQSSALSSVGVVTPCGWKAGPPASRRGAELNDPQVAVFPCGSWPPKTL